MSEITEENTTPRIRQVRCKIHDAEYLEATPERMNDNDVAQLVNKIMIVCEDVETEEIGGGTLSAEDIAAITGIERLMTPREMMEFADRLRNFDGEFVMPIPEDGLLPLDASFTGDPISLEDVVEPPQATPVPVYPPLTPEEVAEQINEEPLPVLFDPNASKQSLGEKFAKRRKQLREEKE